MVKIFDFNYSNWITRGDILHLFLLNFPRVNCVYLIWNFTQKKRPPLRLQVKAFFITKYSYRSLHMIFYNVFLFLLI